MNNNKEIRYFMLIVLAFQLTASFTINYLMRIAEIPMPLVMFLNSAISFGVPSIIYALGVTFTFPHNLGKAGFLKGFKEVFSIRFLSIKNIFYITAMTFSLYPILNLISFISSLFFKNHVSAALEAFNEIGLFSSIFSLAIVPAFFEEMASRGALLHVYKNKPLIKKCLISGLFFGLMHLNFQQFFYAFFIGTIFAFFVHCTKSIFSSVLSHFLINFTSCVTAFFASKEPVLESLEANFSDLLNPQLMLLLIISAIIFVFIIRKFIDYNKTANLDTTEEKILSHETLALENEQDYSEETYAFSAPSDNNNTLDLIFIISVILYTALNILGTV